VREHGGLFLWLAPGALALPGDWIGAWITALILCPSGSIRQAV
jgi:hypothetical protein